MSSMHPYRALRSIYDATLEDPARGINEISAKSALTEWLRTGDTQTGWPSAIPASDSASTIEERSAKTVEWLERLNAFVGHHYLAPGQDGAAGGGTFSQITCEDRRPRRRFSVTLHLTCSGLPPSCRSWSRNVRSRSPPR